MTYQDPIIWPNTEVGGLRRLRMGEVALATTLFGHSVRYHEVWIHRESYLPFNLQPNNIGMTPNGEMWFREGKYLPNFSIGSVKDQHLFLHEMMHVYQQQRGMWVRIRGLFSRFTDYTYSFNKEKLSHYGMEQQASIVSDYWLLAHHGFFNRRDLFDYKDYNPNEPIRDLIAKYKKILRSFPV